MMIADLAVRYCTMDEEAVRREANRLPGAGERRHEAERLRQEMKAVVKGVQHAWVSHTNEISTDSPNHNHEGVCDEA